MNPWPYQGADRIANIALLDKSGDGQGYGLNGPQTRDLAKAKSLEYVAAFNGWNLTVTGSDVPEDVQALYFTGNLFQMLGVPPMLGRYFLPSDDPDGQEPRPVVVLPYKFWKRHFNGDPSVVGKTIQLVHKTYTIIGVMPPHFGFMGPDVYLPLKLSSTASEQYGTFVKLRPGVKPEAAASELQSYFQQFRKQTPDHFPKDYKTLAIQNLSYWVTTPSAKPSTCCSAPSDCSSPSAAATSPFCCLPAAPLASTSLQFAPRWAPAAPAWFASCSLNRSSWPSPAPVSASFSPTGAWASSSPAA